MFNIIKNYLHFEKKKYYSLKLKSLLDTYSFFSSIEKKCNKIFTNSIIIELLKKNIINNINEYNVYLIKYMIYDLVKNYILNTNYKENNELIKLINIDIYIILFQNITLFNEDIIKIEEYKFLINKLSKL